MLVESATSENKLVGAQNFALCKVWGSKYEENNCTTHSGKCRKLVFMHTFLFVTETFTKINNANAFCDEKWPNLFLGEFLLRKVFAPFRNSLPIVVSPMLRCTQPVTQVHGVPQHIGRESRQSKGNPRTEIDVAVIACSLHALPFCVQP